MDSKGEVIGMMVAVPVQSSSPGTVYFAPQAQTGVNAPGVPGVPYLDFRTIPEEALAATDRYEQARSLFVSPTNATETQEGRPGSDIAQVSPPGSPSDQDATGTTPASPPRPPSGVIKPRAIPPAQGSRVPSVSRINPITQGNYRVTYPFQNRNFTFGNGNQSYALEIGRAHV